MPGPGATGRRIATLCIAAALCVAAVAEGRATRDAPPTAQTGGFGEPTCQSCHFQAELDEGPGQLKLGGLPDRVEAGRHTVIITLVHPGMAVAGFQLSARFPDGSQAGSFSASAADAGRVGVTIDGGIEYAHHLYDGTVPQAADTARWTLTWTAPAKAGPVIFHAVGNAGNDDDSPLGDFVYSARAGVTTIVPRSMSMPQRNW
jgi:hypothetical protein